MQRRERLLARARNVCRDRSDAEDLVQETLVRFIQTFEKVVVPPDPRSCESWMMTTLINLFYGQCRKRKVQEENAKEPSLSNELVTPLEPSAGSVFDVVTSEHLAKALPLLSPKLRETFVLHAEGKSYQEIAQAFGVPVGTVAKRLYDARAKLRELLQRFISPEVH